MPAYSPTPRQTYAYAPVDPARLYARRAESGPRRFISLWTLLLAPVVLSGLLTLAVGTVPLTVGSLTVYATLYLPFALGMLWALWFGYWWGAIPLYFAQVVIAKASGIGTGWALLLGLADPLGLGVLVLAYQAAPFSTTLRSVAGVVYFVMSTFVAALTSSAGAFVWRYAAFMEPEALFATWQGWWVGSFLQALVVVAPTLYVAGPAVERWKRRAGLEPHRPSRLSTGRMAFAFSVAVGAMAGYVLLMRFFGWESIGPADGLAPNVAAALDGLSLLQWITFVFIGLAGYFGFQIARGWNDTAEELAVSNRRLETALDALEADRARLAEYASEQEAANRAKDTFFSIISHDLRGPMGSLLGLSQVAEDRVARHDDAELVELAGLMNRSAEGLYSLLINLLEWSRLQTGQMRLKPEWVDLQELALSTVELLAGPASEKGVFLHNRIAPGTVAWADVNMVRSVLLNLIGNGLKFTPEGGSVTVRAQRAPDGLAVTVEDTGIGMSQRHLDRLFRVEKTCSRTGTAGERGSGLGLMLCKEMIERHGGSVRVESAVGVGSVFRFTLPVDPDAIPEAGVETARAQG